eukprot:31364-Eustigmatos_ZCMA.PRE.1
MQRQNGRCKDCHGPGQGRCRGQMVVYTMPMSICEAISITHRGLSLTTTSSISAVLSTHVHETIFTCA